MLKILLSYITNLLGYILIAGIWCAVILTMLDCLQELNIMYYCNGFYFDQYQEARRYADFLLNHARVYRAIFTRAEIDAHNLEGAIAS